MNLTWHREPSLIQMLQATLHDNANLDWLGISADDVTEKTRIACYRLVTFMWKLLAQRCWTFSRHATPPESYICMVSAEHQESTAKTMQKDWKLLLELEDKRFQSTWAMVLWADLLFPSVH